MTDATIDFAVERALPIGIVTQAVAIAGRRGSGKTYGASKIVEGLCEANAHTVVLDPIGSWYGLRLAADGVQSGIPIPVLGGLHGDGPLDQQSGAAVAAAIVETGSSAILDIPLMRKSARDYFATKFAEELYQLQKVARKPICVVLEEAHTFAPQQARGGTERPLLGAMEDLVRLGRNAGIGCLMLTQRPQSIHKSVWSQAEVALVFQLNGARERAAITEWVTDHGAPVKEQLSALPSLQPGEAFLWSPQWLQAFERVHVNQRRTYDASATPEFGTDQFLPEPPPIDTPALRGLLTAAAPTGSDPAAVTATDHASAQARPPAPACAATGASLNGCRRR